MSSRFVKSVLLALGLALAGALASCGGDDDGEGSEGPIDLLGTIMTTEVGTLRNSFALPGGPPGCLTLVPEPPLADADADGVPDSVRCVFDPVGCAYGDDTFSGTTSGVAVVIDPGAAWGARVRFEDFAYTTTGGDPVVTRVRTINGTHVLSGAPTAATLSRQDTISVSQSDGAAATVVASWTGTFTPSGGSTLSLGVGLSPPPGQFELSGTLIWTQGAAMYAFAITTAAPLVYTAECSSPFPVTGEVQLHLIAGGPAGTLSITWVGCDAESVVDWTPD